MLYRLPHMTWPLTKQSLAVVVLELVVVVAVAMVMAVVDSQSCASLNDTCMGNAVTFTS